MKALLLLLIASLSYSQVFRKQTLDGQILLQIESENGEHRVTQYYIPQNDFQEKIYEEIYYSIEEARSSVVQLLQNGEWSSSRSFIEQEIEQVSSGAVWVTRDAWTNAWERRYSNWIQTEVTPEFFLNHNIPSDCADVVVGLRWIFARIHGLPAAFKLASSGRLFSNENYKSSWLNLPRAEKWYNDRRFRASLLFMMNNTYTGSLRGDVYPIKIERGSLRPGSIHLIVDGSNRHARMFKKVLTQVDSADAITTIESTLPPIVRKMYDGPFLATPMPKSGKSGIYNLKRVVKGSNSFYHLDPSVMSDYSREQYASDFGSDHFDLLNVSVIRRLNQNISDTTLVRLMGSGLWGEFNKRDDTVKNGWAFCRRNNCAPGTSNWHGWSTPSRDRKIKNIISGINSILEVADNDAQGVWDVYSSQDFILQSYENRRISFNDLIELFELNKFSSDPRVHPRIRWGF